jgi:hypothetical protein
VRRNRELAGYLLTMRRAEFMDEAEDELERLNEAYRAALAAWLEERGTDHDLPEVGMDVFLAILVGPTQDFARRWLRGTTTTSLREGSELLAHAAWLALTGLRADEKGSKRTAPVRR